MPSPLSSTRWRRRPVSLVPLLDVDVHDVHGLGLVADHVFSDHVDTR